MATQTIGIIVNGATGRIGSTQHLANALVPIIAEGGLALGADRLLPRLLLVGRDRDRLAAVARAHKVADWTTDLDAALVRSGLRDLLRCRRDGSSASPCSSRRSPPASMSIPRSRWRRPPPQGLALLQQAQHRGLKHGAVEDKVHLPGTAKARALTQRRRARAHRRLSARIRLVGLRRQRPAVPTAELELSRRRRRPDPRYVSALALRHRDDRRPHRAGRLERMDRHARTRSTKQGLRYAVAVEDSRRDPGRARGRRLRHHSELMGDAACAATTSSPCRSTAPKARPSPACIAATCSRRADAGDRPFQRDEGHRRRLSRRLEPSRAAGILRQSLPGRMGALPAACCDDAPLQSDLAAGIRDVAFAEACHRSMTERRWIDFPPPASEKRREIRVRTAACRQRSGTHSQRRGVWHGRAPRSPRGRGSSRIRHDHAAAADFPIAAFTRGMTSSAINCMERLLSAGSTQSIPA